MKPIIGINCDYEDGKCFLKKEYIDAIALTGGIPVILPIVKVGARCNVPLPRIDGLLLGGGNDIPPERYGESPHEKAIPIPKQKEDFDFLLVKNALDMDLPILGICYGLQLINVSLGGSLIQDISSQYKTSINHKTGTHIVRMDKDSRLYKILSRESVEVNSTHHQAIKSLGNKLRVSAVAGDGIIEAVEGTDNTYVVGVQWHPERIIKKDSQIELFRTLINAASK
ncbi:MAG TPA: gamma-glutamyl-gamma-aminobutyrate hydrolase family protein [Candidatus Brocadiia bacterium]